MTDINHISEDPRNITDEELEELKASPELTEEARDLFAARMIMHQDGARVDVSHEWDRFDHIHRQQPRRIRTLRIVLTSVAAAAVVAGFFFLLTPPHRTMPSSQSTLVYEADPQPRNVSVAVDGKEMATAAVTRNHEYVITPLAQTDDHAVVVTVPKGEFYKVVLADQSQVFLSADSRLRFPSDFKGDSRTVILDYGEAYFKVTHDADHPFIVKTPSMETTVLGTEFHIRSYAKADDCVTLVKGKVKVSHDRSEIVIAPGEQTHLNADGTLTKTTVDTEGYTAWLEGYYYFDNMTLQDVMREIGRDFNVSVEFSNQELLNYKIHVVADRSQGLDGIVNALNQLKKVKVTLTGNKLLVE